MPHTTPLPYHRAVLDHLRTHVPAAWAHYTSDAYRIDHDDAVRLHLLQSTYAMERPSHPELYDLADEVREALGVTVPIALYQGDSDGGLNAALFFHPTVARLVVYGPVFERLDDEERRALVAHELAHHLLWTCDEGAHLHVARVLAGLASIADGSAGPTQRLHDLHTEVFCDRAALAVVSADAAIRTLVKVRTNVPDVVAADFLAQSRTLLEAQGTGSRQWSHPEAHLRALCLAGFEHDEDHDVWALLEGPRQLDDLDLVARHALDATTRALVGHLLDPTWFRTETVLGHTRMLFDDEVPPHAPWVPADRDRWGETVEDYVIALLVDYTAVDTGLDDLPFLRGHQVAEGLGLAGRFEDAVYKQLKWRRKDIAASLDGRDSRLAAADEADDDEDRS